MPLSLEDDSTHFVCASCDKIKKIEFGNIVKVAYNLYNSDTQNEFYYRPYYVMLCDKCYEGDEDDGDNNTERSEEDKEG
jgi:hypothetical protein